MMMAKFKVVYEKNACIGAGACAALLEERWKISDMDGKANLLGGVETKPGVFEYEFTEEELEKVLESAEACPVNVIHIYDEEGNKIV